MLIEFDNQLQTHIADLLWTAQSLDQVDHVLKIYGAQAQVVYHMLLAHSLDQVNEVELSQLVLQKFLSGHSNGT